MRRYDTPEQIAKFLTAKWQLGLQGGVVIANPIHEEYAMDKDRIDQAVE